MIDITFYSTAYKLYVNCFMLISAKGAGYMQQNSNSSQFTLTTKHYKFRKFVLIDSMLILHCCRLPSLNFCPYPARQRAVSDAMLLQIAIFLHYVSSLTNYFISNHKQFSLYTACRQPDICIQTLSFKKHCSCSLPKYVIVAICMVTSLPPTI